MDLQGVSRIVASLRHGRWDDVDARVETLALDELPGAAAGFGQLPVYGWSFLDGPTERFASWADRLSLDWRADSAECAHTLGLFQDSQDRHLDFRIWFSRLRVLDPDLHDIPFDALTAAGVRWWDGLHAGDHGRAVTASGPAARRPGNARLRGGAERRRPGRRSPPCPSARPW